jgi:hypothetical protein
VEERKRERKRTIGSVLIFFIRTRGAESAGKMIKFAQAGKFFSKTSPARKTTKHIFAP